MIMVPFFKDSWQGDHTNILPIHYRFLIREQWSAAELGSFDHAEFSAVASGMVSTQRQKVVFSKAGLAKHCPVKTLSHVWNIIYFQWVSVTWEISCYALALSFTTYPEFWCFFTFQKRLVQVGPSSNALAPSPFTTSLWLSFRSLYALLSYDL